MRKLGRQQTAAHCNNSSLSLWLRSSSSCSSRLVIQYTARHFQTPISLLTTQQLISNSHVKLLHRPARVAQPSRAFPHQPVEMRSCSRRVTMQSAGSSAISRQRLHRPGGSTVLGLRLSWRGEKMCIVGIGRDNVVSIARCYKDRSGPAIVNLPCPSLQSSSRAGCLW
ncbi:hypothetical protein BDV95DRAFT_149893 [Massariosphaeria phaeospora]|uniref:Uncharacterized protein n=1 Tax=Massariosphaeria phaeospora TaxID=100035 RepID=A0A7C8MI86_9PLEO|nr:hypothetical protein BDV95DRAFT_149893 [Massariosphaeria phaeospora]